MTVCQDRDHLYRLIIPVRDLLLAFIAIFGYLYYSYKFGTPVLGNNDFYRYQEMVKYPFDLNAAPAPFVLRQVPTFFAYLFYKFGIFYDTRTNFDLVFPDLIETKKIFFAMILSNALAVAVSFVVALTYIRRKTFNNDILISFLYFGIMLSYFYLPFSFIAPLSYGWGWLASVIIVIALLERMLLSVLLGCLLALVTRETILIFVLAFSIFAWASFGSMNRFYMWTALIAAALSAVLLLARTHIVHGYEYEMNLQNFIVNITSFRPTREFIFSFAIPQTLIIVLLISLSATHIRYGLVLGLSLITVMIVSIGTGVSMTGRVIGETLPCYAIIFLLAQLRALTPTDSERFPSCKQEINSGTDLRGRRKGS
jgi:hypothetical protein